MRDTEHFVAKTYAGLEAILQEELEKLGAQNCRLSTRAVEFDGDMAVLYRANYICRFALRILWQIHQFDFRDNNQFYSEIFKCPVEKMMTTEQTMAFSVTMSSDMFKTPLFAAQLAKDAVCDRFRDKYGKRPSVDKEMPDVRFHLHVFNQHASLFLDASGESLHKRGYRESVHPAQISEVTAAAMVKLSGWKADCDFIDPMCGSGTILIEAALAALNVPAGFFRQDYGFFHWRNFDSGLWERVLDEADIRDDVPVNFYGYDLSSRSIGMARANVTAARLEDFIRLKPMNALHVRPKRTPAILMFNPPYGERLEVDDIEELYKNIGNTLKQNFAGCSAFIISSNIQALKNIGLHPTRKMTLFNGPLECKFLRFDLYSGTKKLAY